MVEVKRLHVTRTPLKMEVYVFIMSWLLEENRSFILNDSNSVGLGMDAK